MKPQLKLLAALACAATLDLAPARVLAQDAPADDSAMDELFADSAADEPAPQQPAASAEPSATPAAEPEPLPTIPVAQKPEPVPAPAAVPADPRQIEEIVVTATKRSVSLREIPASITAITGESLEDKGQLNLTDYIQKTPGLTVTQSYAGLSRYAIRGISTDTVPTSALPSPVGFFIGDTAFTDPYIASIIPDLSAFDLAGVQVLKGPQGTLFGGAALSGAIRYELRDPVLGEWQLRGFAQTVQPEDGSLATTTGVAVNIPLLSDDSMALRLGYIRRNYPGTIDQTRFGKEDAGSASGNQYRAILLWQPDDWKLKYTHLSQDFETDDTANGLVTSPDAPRRNDFNLAPSPGDNTLSMDSLELGYAFDSMRVVSLSSYLKKAPNEDRESTYTVLGRPPDGYPPALALFSQIRQEASAFSQELRLQSTEPGPFQWLVGGYLYTYEMDFTLEIVTPTTQGLIGPGSAVRQLLDTLGLDSEDLLENVGLLKGKAHVESMEKALFFDLSYTLWDELDLSAGARLYETTVDGGMIGTGLLLRASNNGMNSDSSAEITERGINPKLALTWRFNDEDSLYAQVSKGFRFGGVQIVPSTASNGVPPTFQSDTLWNHELGLRTSWLDRTLNADLTLFYIRYNNPIITQNTSGIALTYYDNVSSAVSRGLEASLLWNTPVEGLSVSATAALTDAYITAPFEAQGGTMIESGTQMPGTAPQQYSASLIYLRPVGPINVGVTAGYNYIGQGYSSLEHNVEINGYDSFDAGLILSSDIWTLRPKLAINVSNLFDETQVTSGQMGQPTVPGSDPITVYGLNPPRTISARLSFDF